MEARFGPAGCPDSFSEMGYKKSAQMPEYLRHFGLTAFEYQRRHGLRVSWPALRGLAARSQEAGIALSLHTPYYISLSSVEEEKRQKSVGYLLESARIVRELGGDRMVVHSGSCGKISREEAMSLAKDTLQKAQAALDEHGFSEIHICPETMGKVNQLGTLEEVMELCKVDERFLPCIDFGHLNARTYGGIRGTEDFQRILDTIGRQLGAERLKRFHSHFSKIAYTVPGGEKAHLTFADREYGPAFEPLMELIAQKDLAPVIICESAGTQAEDAAAMQECYQICGQDACKTKGRTEA